MAKKKLQPLPPICTMTELAPHMRRSRTTVRQMVIEGVIPADCVVRIGKGSHLRILTARLREAGRLPKVGA